ncbi:MAG TPA: VTC domain-containing protein [Vicinamibacterales bacterium]|nr:VTC domain-containing protein [Vicinamibacterales bacterium]
METRETRDFAREIKFKTHIDRWPEIVRWSRANLSPDGHGAGEHADEYQTCSLYFETPTFHVYRRAGSYGKSKFRIRRYNAAEIMFLERKFRTERMLVKRRTIVPVEDLRRMDTGAAADPAWPGYWFQRRIQLRQLRPLIQLSYDRVARIGDSPTGPVRMTVDRNLNVLPMPDRAFLTGAGMPILQGDCIIEVKYRVQLPAIFKALAATFDLQAQKISKFRSALRSLDYPLPMDEDEEVPTAVADAEREHGGSAAYFD